LVARHRTKEKPVSDSNSPDGPVDKDLLEIEKDRKEIDKDLGEIEKDVEDIEKIEKDRKEIEIFIDDVAYLVKRGEMTEAQLREVPNPNVPADRVIWEERPNGRDIKILPGSTVDIHQKGQRFFTVPGTINPGAHSEI
jgi:Multiubiquitin